ncbi:uncharacterized protein VSU04_015477 [Chlamydotis macqueenii]
MSYGLLGNLLLLLPGGASAEGSRPQQSPGQLWVRPGETAKLSCRTSDTFVNWYKEKPNGTLAWIYKSADYSSLKGKYSGTREKETNFSLAISDAQRNDSGVYYCSSSYFDALFADGTRLVVTDATEPQLSILVPIEVEEPGQPLVDIPLLCFLHDLPQGWDTVRWQPGGEVTPLTAGTVDEDGVLSAWSITWVSAQHWDGTAACTALESGTGKNLSVTITKGHREAGCPFWPLALGLACVSLLVLLHLSLLLCRRRLARADPSRARPAAPSPRLSPRLPQLPSPETHPGERPNAELLTAQRPSHPNCPPPR